MIKPLIAIAAFVAATTANAAPGERIFARDGQTYAYSASNDAQGRIVLTGRNTGSGVAFRYVIDGRQVVGFTGNEPVRFRIALARPAPDAVAAR